MHAEQFHGTAIEATPELGLTEKLRRCVQRHVVDVRPSWEGSEADRGAVSGALIGVVDGRVSRCDPALDIERIAIEGGKCSVLVGPNGAGKSTLFDAFMERDGAVFSEGSHGFSKGVHGKDTLRIARLDQEELLSDIPTLTAREVLDRVTEHYKGEFPVDWENPDAFDRNMRNQETHQRIEELVSKFGKLFEIDQFLDREVRELSGGERTKLSLLMLLGSEPDVLLLDEPTNHLDLESIAKLIGLFDTYKRIGAGVVCVSHVEWFLDMVGQDGTMELQVSDTARTLIHSNSPYKKYKKREQSPAVIRGRIGWKADYGFPHRGSMLFQPKERVTIPDSPIQETEPPSISGGAITVFSGKNGTGKSKMMAEMADRSSKIFTREKGVQIAFLPQLWPERVARGTVEQFFQWIKEQTNPLSDVSVSRFMKEVRDLGFRSTSNDMLKRKLASFSGGEQRLLWFVAASIFQGTDALFLDEPTNHMDHQTMLAIVRAIRDFPGAVVLSTHDLRLMEALEEDTGPSRSGVGTTNIVFTRDGDHAHIAQVAQSPVAYAKSTITQSRKSGGRMQV